MGKKSNDGGSTEGKDPSVHGKKSNDAERNKRSLAHQTQVRANLTKVQMAHAISYVPQQPGQKEDLVEQNELLIHLKKLAPFHDRWDISSIINSGSYGVVLAVSDNKTKANGVIKVARAGKNSYINQQAEWEAFLLEKIFKANSDASIVRLLDKGMLQSHEGQPLEFMCLEFAGVELHNYLSEYNNNEKERQLRCCQVALMILKGIYDLHKEGTLHRDLKPDNMRLMSREQPIVLLFDLGMARMYTDADGKIRPYRSTVGFRGTMEWASLNALKGREQTRYDDLIAWLYCMLDFFHGNKESNQIFPWSSRSRNGKENQLFKSMFAPARYLLRKCPKAFFAINTYLQTAPRHLSPDYGFIADRLKDAMEEVSPGSTADMTVLTKPLGPEPQSVAQPPLKLSMEKVDNK